MHVVSKQRYDLGSLLKIEKCCWISLMPHDRITEAGEGESEIPLMSKMSCCRFEDSAQGNLGVWHIDKIQQFNDPKNPK